MSSRSNENRCSVDCAGAVLAGHREQSGVDSKDNPAPCYSHDRRDLLRHNPCAIRLSSTRTPTMVFTRVRPLLLSVRSERSRDSGGVEEGSRRPSTSLRVACPERSRRAQAERRGPGAPASASRYKSDHTTLVHFTSWLLGAVMLSGAKHLSDWSDVRRCIEKELLSK